ncbi:TolC family protein [Pedobacter cryoconitis]|uniref:Cobalt-zinc-cadmium efflux system outer membrane protein n=1 Tax=Pedobacter cryoconitis TaxID=188932 RepID=A0A7X0J560_9SPHI|nr:TolC family protein [Pedobacter cryoconitis]MBB6501068.1 cobalt-zinc-cadmium efflux system outer membrane protein [Pedobacter cryoconitis]
MYLNKYILSLLLMTGSVFTTKAQVDTLSLKSKISVTQYLSRVGKENLGYAAEQYNVNIAEAGIETAKIFPDPEFSFGAFDNQDAKLHLGQGVTLGLGTTIELGGKRNARIKLAKSETELSKSLLLDYLRNLRADAAIAYFSAIGQHYLLQVQQYSYQTMKQLADADAIRYKLGVITETDSRQSRLEANNLQNGVFQNEADWKNSLVKLSSYMGKKHPDSLLIPGGDFENLERELNYQNLISIAQETRADAVAALNSKTVADRNLALVKANRTIDLGINAGLQFNGVSTNEEAPTPYHRTFNAGFSVPLKFSNHYKGDLKAARYTIKQAGVQYEQVLQQIQVEVTQAYFNYMAAQKQVQQYKNGLLAEAKKILNAKIYSYKRGETSLLEVLNAQRTYNEVQQGFYESQSNYAAALIELERAAGIWDIR